MKANDFVKIVKDLAAAKKLDWSSFRENRIWNIGKAFEEKKMDVNQAIADIAAELKTYNVNRDDIKMLTDKFKR